MKVPRTAGVEFKASFTIPANDVINKIEIINSLVSGLSYEDANVFVDGDRQYTNIGNDSTTEEALITLYDDITKGDEIKKIDVIIEVMISDLDALIEVSNNPEGNGPLENVITITVLDINDEIISEEEVREELNFEKYNLYGLGLGYTVKKIAGETTYLIANLTSHDALPPPNGAGSYEFTIKVNEHLDISEAKDRNTFIILNNEVKEIWSYGGGIEVTDQTAKVRVQHTSAVNSNTFYIAIPAVTRDTITNVGDDFILSESELILENFVRVGSPYETVAISPTFNIRTNFEYIEPEQPEEIESFMRISKGSKIEFKINFNIPKNDVFNKITITDNLATGLSYGLDKAVVFIDNEVVGEPDVIDSSTTDKEIILDLNTNIAQGEKDKEVRVVIIAVVTDLEALLEAIDAGVTNQDNPNENTPLENIALIETRDVNGILSEAKARVELEFDKYDIYGAGSGYTAKKRAGETVYLIANATGVNSLQQPDLSYEFRIKAHPQLDILDANPDNSFITFKDKTIPISELEYKFAIKDREEVVITVKHISEMKGDMFYISIPAVTKSTVIDVEENFISSEGNIDFLHFDYDIREFEILSSSPTFEIRTNFEIQKPELNSAIKIIL